MGWNSPLLVTRQVHVTLAKVKLLGASSIYPQPLLPILSCPDLSSFAVTSVPAGRFAWVSGLQVPSQTQCGITRRAWHPGLMLRGRNTLTDKPLFIRAINNSHKNPLLSLLCSAKPCQWERRRHLFYGRLEAGFAFFWLT